jgi:hypothetical protein
MGKVRRAMAGDCKKDPVLSRDHVLRARREGTEKG